MSKLLTGAAIRDISPKQDYFPMESMFGETMVGIHNPLHVRAITLDDGNNKAVLITQELAGVEDPDRLVSTITTKYGLAEEYIFLQATHAHSVPMMGMFAFMNKECPPDILKKNQELAEYVFEQTMAAVQEAFSNMVPSVIKYSCGQSYINVNRSRDYYIRKRIPDEEIATVEKQHGWKIREEDGQQMYTSLGVNPTGPSDKTLSVLKFERENGEPIAWFLNHSTHSTVMHRNVLGLYDSDFSGLTSLLIEKEYPGCVAAWTAGSSGDNDPIKLSDNITANPETGISGYSKNQDPLDLLERVAYPHFEDFLQITRSMEILSDVTIKGATEIAEPQSVNPEDPAKIEMSLLQIGPVTLVGVHGELFTTIGLHMKKASKSDKTIIVSYNAKTSRNNAGYILDDEGLKNGAWGWQRFKAMPGTVQDAMTETMFQMMQKAK